MLIGVPGLKHETGIHLVFKPHVFLSFGKSAIPANESKKNAKTLGSCKPNAHWCANLKARARDRPHNFFDISIAQGIDGKKKLICTPKK